MLSLFSDNPLNLQLKNSFIFLHASWYYFPLMIRIFQFLTMSNMSYVQDDIIFPLIKWMPHMPVQWCTSFSSVTEDSMATTHPVLQASDNKPHPCIFMASFSKNFFSIHYCNFYFPTAIYFSSNWCITSVQKGSMTLPVTTNRTTEYPLPLVIHSLCATSHCIATERLTVRETAWIAFPIDCRCARARDGL